MQSLEKFAQKIAEQSVKGFEELRGKMFEFEDKQSLMQKHVGSDKGKPNRTIANDRTDNTLLNSALSGTNYERDQLRQVEKKIAKRVTESVEQLGEIIKDYAKKQKKIDNRMSEIEIKVFGNSKTPQVDKKSGERKYSSIKPNNSQLQSSGTSARNKNQVNSFKR